MKFNAGCWRRRLVVLVIVTSWLTGCATAGFEAGGVVACPPVVEYSRAEQVQVAEEVAALPENVVIIEWLADYAVLKEQVNACK